MHSDVSSGGQCILSPYQLTKMPFEFIRNRDVDICNWVSKPLMRLELYNVSIMMT